MPVNRRSARLGNGTLMAKVLMSRLVRLTSRCVAKSFSTPLKKTEPSRMLPGGQLHRQRLPELDGVDVGFLDAGAHPQVVDVDDHHDRRAMETTSPCFATRTETMPSIGE